MWSLDLNKLQRNLFWLLCFLLPVQLGYHFWPQSSYVMGLRIDYLSPTIYLTDFLVLAILGLWGMEKVKSQKSKVKITTQNLKVLIFPISVFVFLLVNSLLAQNSGAALYKFAKIIEFSLLGLYVAKNSYELRVTSYKLAFAVVYSSLIALAQFIKQASLDGLFWWLGERTFNAATPGIAKVIINGELMMRPYATFPHPNVLAGFILVSLILNYSITDYELLITKVIRHLALALGLIAVALSFSRSVWLVGLFVAFFLIFKKKKFFLVISYALLVISIFVLVPRFSTDEAIFQRLQLIKAATLMIQTSPLSGIGLNNFLVRLPEFWGPTGTTFWLQPVHNIYLLITAETGIIGLLVFIWFLVLAFKKLLVKSYQLKVALGAILLLGLFDHYWLTLQQTQLLFAIVLGLSWAKVRDSVKYS